MFGRPELVCSPVDANRPPAADVLVDLHGLARVDVLVLHEPVWLIVTNRNGGQVKWTVLVTNLFKCLTIARVSAKPEPGPGSNHRPTSPQHPVIISSSSLAPMVGWSEHNPDLGLLQRLLLPPGHLLHPVLPHRGVVLHPLSRAQGDKPGDVGLRLDQSLDRVQIKMIVVTVTDDHSRDARKVTDLTRRRSVPLGSGELDCARSVGEYRVAEDGAAVDFR